jgi:uncharacterized protein with HEPN domain
MKKNEHNESRERLEHILQAIIAIEEYTNGKTEEIFTRDVILNNAVLFQFSVIGEAIKHVEREKLEKYAYPWYRVRSFRNLIAHEYFNVKLSAVWMIIENDLSGLKSTINLILANEF